MKTKKSLGQHFLTSPKILGDIVHTSHIEKGDTVLEIGPGMGTLTQALLESGAFVTAIEKDDRLIPILTDKFSKYIGSGDFAIVHEDILEWKNTLPQPYKIVANIPYYITGQIIRMFLQSTNQPTSMTLLVQKEVAQRIVARDGKESLLSLSVKIYGKPVLIRTVPAGAFNPPPTVDSAVLHIESISKENLRGISEEKFFAIIHAGFAHKRKQLLPNLSHLYTKDTLMSAFDVCALPYTCRAEDVSLETWVRLAQTL